MAISYLQSFPMHKNKDIGIFPFCMQVMSGSHSIIQHTRTTVLWPWRTLLKGVIPCFAWLTSLLVADNLILVEIWLSQETGSSPNETRVPSRNLSWDFYRARPENVLRLNRRRGGVEGIYHCEINDSINVLHTIYIGVYKANTGKLLSNSWVSSLSLSFKFNLRFELYLALVV